MTLAPPDGLAPQGAHAWQAIAERLADIEQGLTWGDLVQARTALRELPGSLRMLGLAAPADAADVLWAGFQAAPGEPARLDELARLKTALDVARAAPSPLAVTGDEAAVRRVLVAATGPTAQLIKGLKAPGWRFTVLTSPQGARIWLRMGGLAAILWDPAHPAFAAEWVAGLPADVPVLSLGPTAVPGLAGSLPSCLTAEDLAAALDQLP